MRGAIRGPTLRRSGRRPSYGPEEGAVDLMKTSKIMVLCLVAAFALSAYAAVSASAAPPDIGRCKHEGSKTNKVFKYKSATCTTLASANKGEYEWYPLPTGTPSPKLGFTTHGSKATLETLSHSKVVCGEENATGEYTGEKTVGNVLVTFGPACSAEGFFTCSSAGEPAGTIKTNALAGELHWEKGPAAKKIALDLAPQSEPLFVKIECGKTIKIEVRGSVLVNIKDGKMETTLVQKYVGSKGKQKPEFYEEVLGTKIYDFLESRSIGEFEQAGQTFTDTQTNEEASRRTGSHSLSIAPAAGSASAAGATEGVGPQWLHAPPRLGEWASARGSYIEAGRQTSTGARPRATRALSLRARPHRPAPRDSRCMARSSSLPRSMSRRAFGAPMA